MPGHVLAVDDQAAIMAVMADLAGITVAGMTITKKSALLQKGHLELVAPSALVIALT